MANHSEVFDALGDPTRRAIFERVAARPRSVGELAEGVDVSRPAVSQHLRVLKDAGLVVDRQEGTRRIYSLDVRGMMAMHAFLERFWDRALASFQAAADGDEDEDGKTKKKRSKTDKERRRPPRSARSACSRRGWIAGGRASTTSANRR
jgi:DNA-binding transcriptional ArsR family regulator